ncbi:T9SS sorting signal type C domain-containing protein [Xanthomarina gelatinilytica]|uniref:T9SS sorting signal type C domain-containing protein n=1 Tax=Xanthomarina gelatinilytica TaxID=1137281 RepID=UPI003AA87290
MVYDILGRQLFNEIDLHSNKLEIESIKKSNTVLVLKITLENNHVVFRKILF